MDDFKESLTTLVLTAMSRLAEIARDYQPPWRDDQHLLSVRPPTVRRALPPAEVVTEFLKLQETTRSRCIEILLTDPKNVVAQEAVAELDTYVGYFVSPRQMEAINGGLDELTYYADQFCVPKERWRREFYGKMIRVVDPRMPSGEFCAVEAEIRRVLDEFGMESRTYAGRSLEELILRVRRDFVASQLSSIRITTSSDKVNRTAVGATAQAALERARNRVPADATEVGQPVIARQSQDVNFKVEAADEATARSLALAGLPQETTVNNIACVRHSRKGFCGCGRRAGVWQGKCSTPFEATISFVPPIEIRVTFACASG